jgi:hypothetical protein
MTGQICERNACREADSCKRPIECPYSFQQFWHGIRTHRDDQQPGCSNRVMEIRINEYGVFAPEPAQQFGMAIMNNN